jgi:hypothetical protein
MLLKNKYSMGQAMIDYLVVTAALVFFLLYPTTQPAWVAEMVDAFVLAYRNYAMSVSLPY